MEERNSDAMIKYIIRDMDEGVMLFDGKGIIHMVNPAAERILAKPKEEMLGLKFAAVFLADTENDPFFQAVLDAIYDPEVKHDSLIPYHSNEGRRMIHMVTALTVSGDGDKGVIITISDITEITELKIKHAEQIAEMMSSMVRAFVTAVDARSPYNVHHTNNMVMMAEAFLDWLDKTENPMSFDETKKNAFLMSIALHDIGKLSVPRRVMDKPTRLSYNLEKIKERFLKVNLLRRIDLLEGRLSEEEYEEGISCTSRLLSRSLSAGVQRQKR